MDELSELPDSGTGVGVGDEVLVGLAVGVSVGLADGEGDGEIASVMDEDAPGNDATAGGGGERSVGSIIPAPKLTRRITTTNTSFCMTRANP
ncbi:MAG TPA: hypothetical protein VKX96_17660 [Chloroflexota bacterium]|nr:hypothetical protein [Chloroflexota bacterium]